ncbi:MAG: ATP-binding protein [Anaerobutyricum soehngenii]
MAVTTMEVMAMINDETKRKLRELNIAEIIAGLEIQQSNPASLALSFDERMQFLVDYVYQEKYNGKIQRLIKSARFRFPQADIHGVYFDNRGLDKNLLNDLFTCQYIDYHQSIILQGFTGSGKTYLGCALGKQACLNQIKTRYIRLPDLLMEYSDANLIPGNQKKILNRYSRIPLLILDEWLVSDISDSELYFLFELMERRSDTSSTIFCTQYRKDDWVKRLGEGVQAEAIVDRYAYTGFWIETGSKNMREYCSKL